MTWRNQKTPEGYVKHAVIEYLAAERIFYLRTNSGTQLIQNPETGKTRKLQMAPPGTADILALPSRWLGTFHWIQPLWIETKAAGKKQSPAQIEFERDRIAEGHAYIVSHSIDDVAEWLHNFRRYKP